LLLTPTRFNLADLSNFGRDVKGIENQETKHTHGFAQQWPPEPLQ